MANSSAEKTKTKKERVTSIYARICYSGFKFKYYIPENINPKYWNKETQRAKQTGKFKEHSEFNARLNNIESDIRNVYRKYINDHGRVPAPATLKPFLDKEIRRIEVEKANDKTFFAFFDQFINRSKEGTRLDTRTKKNIVYNTTKGYISTCNHLKEFEKKFKNRIDFETIDLDFYNAYITYLTKDVKLSNNTIGDHIKRLKTVLNEATEQGINKNLAFRSRYFSKITEQTASIYLTESELQEIEHLDLKENKKLEHVRDLFLIGCYTGLRYSDYSILKPEQIKDGFIQTTQVKTGTPVVIPIHPTVNRIIEKYNGSLPRSISNQKTNEYLKDLGKKVPSLKMPFLIKRTKGGITITGKDDGTNYKKWELLTTHTARRSFATNEYLAGTQPLTIMAITGHRTEKAFLKYIKLTPNEHAKLLKLQWSKRQSLKAI